MVDYKKKGVCVEMTLSMFLCGEVGYNEVHFDDDRFLKLNHKKFLKNRAITFAGKQLFIVSI